jgi:thiol-disulfide isomerase/thioredoxin
MKKIIAGGLTLATVALVSSCTLFPKSEVEDAMKLEGMMPKEDQKTIDAMMKKTEENSESMEKDEAPEDAMMKKDDAMMKKEVSGYTMYNASAVSDALAAGKNVVLFFHAPWCPTCKAADANFVKETAPANTVVFKTDYDSNTDLRKKYGVTYQHTFVSLNADGSLKKKMSGADSFSELAGLN